MSNRINDRLLCGALVGSMSLVACGPKAEEPASEVKDSAAVQSLLPGPLSVSCAEVKAAGLPMDRNYVLYLNAEFSKPYTAFCDAEGGTYLTLPTGAGRNFSQYINVAGKSVSTTWNRVRFDPATQTLDIEDFRFATSTGGIPQWDTYTVVYGMAGDCSGFNSSVGHANVDLTGLPFVVTANWRTDGYYAAGGSTRSSNDQVVDITGGGYCGNTSVDGAFTLSYVGYGSCDAVAAAGGTQDQDYTLYLGQDSNKPYEAYCATGGGTYLTLPTGAGRNFSQYINVAGKSVSTTWNRVRFDPATQTLDIEDFRFATSTGGIPQWDTYTVVYGMAGDCSGFNSSVGHANVDLTGLPFVVTANWRTDGYYAAGGSTRSSNDQVVDITGGGYCGNTSVDGAFTLSYRNRFPR